MWEWQVVTGLIFDDFLPLSAVHHEIHDEFLSDDHNFGPVVPGYRVCVYSRHRYCNCHRSLLLRAASPEEDQEAFGVALQDELFRSLCQFLDARGLPIPDDFPPVELGYWWEDPESKDNMYQAWMIAWFGARDDVLYRE